jgi:hypothetical protein
MRSLSISKGGSRDDWGTDRRIGRPRVQVNAVRKSALWGRQGGIAPSKSHLIGNSRGFQPSTHPSPQALGRRRPSRGAKLGAAAAAVAAGDAAAVRRASAGGRGGGGERPHVEPHRSNAVVWVRWVPLKGDQSRAVGGGETLGLGVIWERQARRGRARRPHGAQGDACRAAQRGQGEAVAKGRGGVGPRRPRRRRATAAAAAAALRGPASSRPRVARRHAEGRPRPRKPAARPGGDPAGAPHCEESRE